MGKTAKPKNRQISSHSRAARRAPSPSLPLPKTPTTTKTTAPAHSPPSASRSILSAHTSSGISKRTLKSKPLKRAQRLRALEAAERAEENNDKLALKVAKSLGKEKKVKERRKGWEEVNEAKARKVKEKEKRAGNAFGALGAEGGEGEGEWEDLEMETEGADVDVKAGGEVQDAEPLAAMPVPDECDPDL